MIYLYTLRRKNVSDIFRIREINTKITPRAIPKAKSPLPVSRAIAVVIVRVCHLILPPSIIAEPTSPTMRPNAVSAETRIKKRASHILVTASLNPEAPSVISVCLSLLSKLSIEAAV